MKKVGKVLVVDIGCEEGKVRYFGLLLAKWWQISVLLLNEGKELRAYVEEQLQSNTFQLSFFSSTEADINSSM